MKKTQLSAVALSTTALAAIGLLWPNDAYADIITVGASNTSNPALAVAIGSASSPLVGTVDGATLAGFGITGIASISFNTQGTPFLPEPAFDTNTISVTSSAATTLFLWVTERGLTAPPGNLLSSFTANICTPIATCGGTVVERTFIDPGDGFFVGTPLSTSPLFDVTTLGTAADVSTPPPVSTYSLTVEYEMTFTSATSSQNDTINISQVAVPEPASLALFGTALLGLGVFRNRRRA